MTDSVLGLIYNISIFIGFLEYNSINATSSKNDTCIRQSYNMHTYANFTQTDYNSNTSLFFIGKLHTQPMGSEPTTSPFTLMGEGNAIELELIGIARIRV